MTNNPWYGVVDMVDFVPGGIMSDPSLVYRGYEFNYWDVEEAIFEMYSTDVEDSYHDEDLAQLNFDLNNDHWLNWLRENSDLVRAYLDDYIATGAPISWRG